MPIRTEYFFLEAFLDGDAYLAAADKRRFNTIDNQLYRLAEIMGDGRIEGWEITAAVFPNVIVTLGNGMIDGYYVNTYGDQTMELSVNGVFYFYAQRRIGVIGTTGPKSDLTSLIYEDLGPPAMPTGFSLSSPDPFVVACTWDANSEIDFDHYDLQRSIDDITFTSIATLEDETHYEDTVDEDTTYYYRLYAVDESSYKSDPATGPITTAISTILPPNPISVEVRQSEAAINVLWKRPPIDFADVQNWLVTYVPLDSDNSPILPIINRVVNKNLYFDRIDDLDIGQRYRVTLHTVDTHERTSTGYVRNITPQPTPAPRDPEGIAYTMTDTPGGVQVNLSWTSGDTPYDPATSYRYKIYITVAGQQESWAIDVPIGQTEYGVYLYKLTEDGSYFSIPENTLITIRMTSVAENGKESYGNYIRFVTALFALPKRLANISADFDSDTGNITITWDVQPDTDDVRIVIEDEDLEEAYEGVLEIVNSFLGRANRYVLENAKLNHRYTIRLTPYNVDDVAGPTSTVVELTLIAGGLPFPETPPDIEVKTNDRQVLLTWIESSDLFVAQYKIYRMTGSILLDYSQWQLIDTLPKDITRFTDYGLENDQIYSYYITSVDVYGRESLHLPDEVVNLNFVEAIPKAEGILTEPTNVQAVWVGDDILLTWDALLEEFDGFTIYRSINNLHSWEQIATVDKNTLEYTDTGMGLIDNTTYYYVIDKTNNDADIVVQTTDVAPENSIYLATVTTDATSVTDIDVTTRRDIKDLIDPLAEYTSRYILPHRHRNIEPFDPDRIDLNPELVITDWTTVDGRIFTTEELDISGSSYIVKIDGRFPSTFFQVDSVNRRLVFSEAIVDLDPETGEIIGDIPSVEVKVLGIEEIQGVLDAFRFDEIHARQVQFGSLNKEQLPSINHEGRIREQALPKRFLLERFSNHTFIVPQGNTDTTKNFGDGTTFYSVIESDGDIEEVIDFDQEDDGALVGFRRPSFSPTTQANLKEDDIAEVNSDPGGFQSEKSYNFGLQFEDNQPTRWARITSYDTPIKPNPVIDLTKRLRFRILSPDTSFYLTLGIREISASNLAVGSDGGTTGPIEWVGISSVATGEDGSTAPIGILIQSSSNWQEIDIDLQKTGIISFENGNNSLPQGLGVLEHFAFTVNPDDESATQPFNVYIDKLEQVDDLIVAGTSQGILKSDDFGTTWELARLTNTPVHKFYRAINNRFLWAITADEVLLSVDPAHWFATSGTTGVQYIRDIVEDNEGDMYISTDKGVYWLEIALVQTLSRFEQTQPVVAFTTDCYAMYHNYVSSGIDEIWVSTEIGVYKTLDKGITWQDSGMNTAGLIAYEIQNISDNPDIPNLMAITRKHLLRKFGNETTFSTIANFEEQHNIFDIWTMSYFGGQLYISTGEGVFMNSVNILFTSGIVNIAFKKVLPGLDLENHTRISFCLDVVNIDTLETRLFVGQENRLVSVDENNVLKIKKEYRNKELPSFYLDDVEINIGYIYNVFNNVLSLREPQEVNVIATAAHLPRRVYIAQNEGWVQTNPETEVFLYKNGFPTWIDFKFDNNDILSNVQVVQSRLESLPTLTSFNSLDPTAQQYLDLVLSDITTLIEGGDDETPLINNTTLIQFYDDYTRFLTLVTEELINTYLLTIPDITRTGIRRVDRLSGTRAQILEEKDDFEAEDSTAINIDVWTGEIDFLTAYSQSTSAADRAKYSFTKYDNIEITIFNANVSNTGEFTHRELEDKMEDINTGLTSDLARSAYTNLIKGGIFAEKRNNFLFDIYPVNNIQSKFYAAHNSEWYDILNSTIDYTSILRTSNLSESRFANTTALFTDDPYFNNKIWVGTDNNITQYGIGNGILNLENIVAPGGNTAYFIWDVYIYREDEVYVVGAEKNTRKGHIWVTYNYGTSWSELLTINLPDEIYTFRIVSGTKTASTETGMFYCDNDFGTWYPADVVPSDILGSDSLALAAFIQPIRNIDVSSFVIVESDRWFYTSGSGIEFFAIGRITNNNATVVNKILRFKNITWVATDRGLYNDGNSILSDAIQFGLQTEMEDSATASANIEVNDIVSGGDALYCCASNGKVYRRLEISGEDTEWSSYEIPDVGTIHKIIYQLDGSSEYLVVITYNKLVVLDITPDVGVFG